METVTDFIFLASKITADGDSCNEIKRHLLLGRKAKTNLDSVLKTRDFTLLTKAKLLSSQSYCFSSGHVQMWALECKEGWAPRTDAFELWCWRRLLKGPLDNKEIQPVHPKGNQPWIFIESTDAEAEVPILWPADAKSWLIGKDPDAGKDWRKEEKRMTEDEMGWMVSLIHWAWVWANSWRWWWTGKPGILQSMESQRVGHTWVTEQQQPHWPITVICA